MVKGQGVEQMVRSVRRYDLNTEIAYFNKQGWRVVQFQMTEEGMYWMLLERWV